MNTFATWIEKRGSCFESIKTLSTSNLQNMSISIKYHVHTQIRVPGHMLQSGTKRLYTMASAQYVSKTLLKIPVCNAKRDFQHKTHTCHTCHSFCSFRI